MNKLCYFFIMIVLMFSPLLGGDEEKLKALESILPDFKKVWNAKDFDGYMDLFHSESKMKKYVANDDKKKAEVKEMWLKLVNEAGVIKEQKIGSYIEKNKRYVVKTEYSIKGLIPGTFDLVKVDGKWLLKDFNIDGQGEPELKE